LNTELTLVSDLQQQSLKSSLTGAALQAAITTENNQLQQMMKILPQYDDLATQVALVQGQLTQLMSLRISTLVNGGVSSAIEVKVLDPATIQPSRLTPFILSVLGPLLGLVIGLVVIYILAYFDRRPETSEDAQLLTGVPVLSRIPNAY
jgi:capsular polysaccharide biosynthesis protein